MHPSHADMVRLSLLYVEDDPHAREMVGRALALKFPGVDLLVAENGQAGLELFRAHRPEIVLTDVSMPVMDGIQMAREIRALGMGTRIVVVTAFNDTAYLLEAIKLGISHYVLKPVEHRLLFEAIDDCAARVTMERELRESRELLRAVVEGTADAVYVKDLEGRYLLFNAAASRMAGKSADDVIGRDDLVLFPADAARAITETDRAALDSGKAMSFEQTFTDAAGERWTFITSKGPLFDADGLVTGLYGVSRDITDRKRSEEALQKAHDELEARVAERTEELARTIDVLRDEIIEREKTDVALRESEKKYRTLFEESKDMIYIVSLDGGVQDTNPAGTDLFGYTKEEFLSLDVARELYCDPADRKRFLRELLDKGYVRDNDVCMRRKGGELLHVLQSATVIRNEQGEITGYRGIIHDVTERKRLEQQLLQAQKMESIGLLAGGIAHDFNNLLTAISGYSQIIQEQCAAGDEMLESCIDQVMGATNRAVELTRSLLAFSRKQIINPQPVYVCDIVINLSKLLARIIGEDIELTTTLADRQLMVLADSGQIDQVLINLATNARDAMPRGGRLQIRTELVVLDRQAARRRGLDLGGSYALIAVTDTGVGMDRETQERIFEPFFTTKETGKGTGLGLSIIYGIVKQHSGSIAVESEPGRGTTFTVYLPLLEEAVAEPAVQAPPAPGGGTETLLLAEDDAMVRKYMERILNTAGYTVIAARNGTEAVERFREHRERIALVVCDVVMPKKNGREVYDEVRTIDPQARFLFTSGYNDEIIHTKGILHENIELLAKPINREVFLAKLREMLDA